VGLLCIYAHIEHYISWLSRTHKSVDNADVFNNYVQVSELHKQYDVALPPFHILVYAYFYYNVQTYTLLVEPLNTHTHTHTHIYTQAVIIL